MVEKLKRHLKLERLLFFFPFQLFVLHIKRNHFLLLFWLLLYAIISGEFALKFGLPYLFLAPEYLGSVGIRSYAILGFSLGAFIMAFNIYTYILHAHRFPFLGTLARPFFKFCVNNFIIPLSFIVVYIFCSVRFQYWFELLTPQQIAINIFAFLLGNAVFIALAVLYFFPTNKNIYKITGISAEELEVLVNKRKAGIRRKSGYYFTRNKQLSWKVSTYLTHPFKVLLARDSTHYDSETLQKVFLQNHVNATLFEMLIISGFFVVGAFQFNPYFIIPAAATTCLLFTVFLMVVSVALSWLKGWTLTVLLALLIIINYASADWNALNAPNYAYGLDYTKEPARYSAAVVDSLNQDLQLVRRDYDHQIAQLNKWLSKTRKDRENPEYKPKLILINTSGGGLRSSLWTLSTLQRLDSLMEGQLMPNTQLMSGSSGGTLGAAFFRELHLRRDSLAHSINSQYYRDQISTDILNRVIFSLATNDLFIRFRTREIDGKSYTVDRGMAFEDQVNANTGYILDKKVKDYQRDVDAGNIPILLFAPTVVNDGRRLLISSQSMSYFCHDDDIQSQRLNLGDENIEFNRFFAGHGADNLLMSSALRLNSTFPYVLPYATLPSEPRMEVMDAGLRDNYGIKLTAQYIRVFKQWIDANTSGIIIVQIRDTEKVIEPDRLETTIIDRLLNPIGSFYGNLFNDQDFNMDQILRLTQAGLTVPIHHIPFEMRFSSDEQVALSWHLTALEKKRVNESIYMPWNKASTTEFARLIAE